MSEKAKWGSYASLVKARKEREAAESPAESRAARAAGAPQTLSAQKALSAPQALSAQEAPSAPGTAEVVPQAPSARATPRAQEAPSAQEALRQAHLSVSHVAGYLRLPNTILDSVLPLLDPFAQAVFLRLYRLTWGHQRETCTVSFEALVQKTGVSRRQVIRSIEKLESLGLVERMLTPGRERSRGNLYRIPELAQAKDSTSAQQAPRAGQAPS